MLTIVVTTREKQERVLEAKIGQSVMQIIRDGGVDELLALCGGACSCATCHVHVDPAFAGKLPPISLDEGDLLDSSPHRDDQSRLSCQLPFRAEMDGLRVRISEED